MAFRFGLLFPLQNCMYFCGLKSKLVTFRTNKCKRGIILIYAFGWW